MPLLSGTLLFIAALAVDLGAGLAHRRGHRRWALLGWVLTVVAILGLVVGSLAPRPASAVTAPDQDLAKILASAGFHDQGLVTGLEIIFAESGGNSSARNQNSNGTTDRGIWQINSVHTQVSDQCADDPVCATRFAFQLSRSGTYWQDWTTYTSGAYQRFSQRAHAAVNSVAPGCDLVWDPQCPVKLAWQGVVGTGVGTATAVSTAGLPALPNPLEGILNLPANVLGKALAGIAAWVLYSADVALLKSFEGLWGAMVAGEDNLGGKESWGGRIVFDLTPVERAWRISLGIAGGGSLLTFLLLLGIVMWMARGGPQHGAARLIIYFLAMVIAISSSFWLLNQVIAIDNALVNSVNGATVLELRQLPAYQGLNLKDPSLLSAPDEVTNALVLTAAAIVIVVELALVTGLYIVRAIVLVILVVTSPFWLGVGIIPEGRGVTVYFGRLFLAMTFVKFVNALIFATFLLLGASGEGIFNLFLIGGLLFVMLLVPGTLIRAIGSPHPAWESAHNTVRTAITYAPLRAVGREAWAGARTRLGLA